MCTKKRQQKERYFEAFFRRRRQAREGVQRASHVRREESPSWWLSFDNHMLHHGNLSLFMCWSGCSRDKTTTPVKKLHKLPFWGACTLQPPRHFAVLLKSAVWESVYVINSTPRSHCIPQPIILTTENKCLSTLIPPPFKIVVKLSWISSAILVT